MPEIDLNYEGFILLLCELFSMCEYQNIREIMTETRKLWFLK